MDRWECKTSDSYMENRFRFREYSFRSIRFCGGLGVAWVLWLVLGVRGQLEGISSFLLPYGFWGWDWACQPWRQHLYSLTYRLKRTSYPFFWGTVSRGSGWAQPWYVVENDTVCAQSSLDIAQTLMKVKGQLWEISSFLLPRVSWVNPNHQAYTESSFTRWAISLAQRVTGPSGPPPLLPMCEITDVCATTLGLCPIGD